MFKTLLEQKKEELITEITNIIEKREQYIKDFNGISDPIHRMSITAKISQCNEFISIVDRIMK